jgi:hypothetical protein
MMRKRGESLPFEEGTKAIIAFIVLALVIFGVVTFLIGSKLSGSGNLLQSVKNILPSFGGQPSIAPGTAIVGIYAGPIEDPVSATSGALMRPSVLTYYLMGGENLSYYTGAKWIETRTNEVRIEQKVLNTEDIRDALARFYFTTTRDGQPTFALGDYQQVQVYIPSSQGGLGDNAFDGRGSLALLYGPQEGYAGDPKQRGAYFALNDKFYEDKELDDEIKGSVPEKNWLVAWRDQLVSGASCQKTIELSFKQGESVETHRYVVVKSVRPDGMYLYVDLNAPVDDAADVEKYASGCFQDSSLISPAEKNVINTGSIFLELTDKESRVVQGIFWMPLSNGLGRWYFVEHNTLVAPPFHQVCDMRKCSSVRLTELESSNFYLGAKAIFRSSFVKDKELRIYVLPHLVPEYYDPDSDYASSFSSKEPSILYEGVAPYTDKDISGVGGGLFSRPSPEALLTLTTSAYNKQAAQPSHYYAYPYRYLPGNPPHDERGGYYRFYFETTELPLFVGHNATGLQIYYASDSFNAAASFPRWDNAAGLTKVGSLNDLGNGNYQISLLSDIPDDVPAGLQTHLRNLNGLSINDLIFEHVNYP